jgi:hypothetical protein
VVVGEWHYMDTDDSIRTMERKRIFDGGQF